MGDPALEAIANPSSGFAREREKGRKGEWEKRRPGP